MLATARRFWWSARLWLSVRRAPRVTAELGAAAGGPQIVGGPMLLVPYQRVVETTDDQGRTQRRTDRGAFVVFAATGQAAATLTVEERRRGIYRAAIYNAATDFDAAFEPAATLEDVDPSYRFDWSQARVVMFVSDSRSIRNAPTLRFGDGRTAAMEPISDLSLAAPAPDYSRPGLFSSPAAPCPAISWRSPRPRRLPGRAGRFHGADPP